MNKIKELAKLAWVRVLDDAYANRAWYISIGVGLLIAGLFSHTVFASALGFTMVTLTIYAEPIELMFPEYDDEEEDEDEERFL